jgi:hypothetical protein
VRAQFSPQLGMGIRPALIIKSQRDASSPRSDTSWLPGHEGTGQGSPNVGSHLLWCGPTIFLDTTCARSKQRT